MVTRDGKTLLTTVNTLQDVFANLRRFQLEAPQHRQYAIAKIVNLSWWWVYDETSRTFGPTKFVGFLNMDFATYQSVVGYNESDDGKKFNTDPARTAIQDAARNAKLDPEFKRDESLHDACLAWARGLLDDDASRNKPKIQTRSRFLTIRSLPADLQREAKKSSRTVKQRQSHANDDDDGPFDARNYEDNRELTKQQIACRPGQQDFRNKLLKDFQGRCVVTGCDADQALEAAHIIRFLGPDSDKRRNGLLLREDIHTLFDNYLIGIHPDTLTVVLSSQLRSKYYKELDGKNLSDIPGLDRRKDALQEKWKSFQK